MDRKSAETFVEQLRKFDAVCNTMTEFSETLPEDEGKAFRRTIGEATSRLSVDVSKPIVKTYPDLDLDT